ncbi:MAG: choice-of-anchor D domain-containing protein, partial [Candidatus Glassbacteria bacterium]|nr:choice-of-anchor D domain-containing protein [Candidatus Glassbacteria bacterium]
TGRGEYAVSLTKAVLADTAAGRYFPLVTAGAVINPFSGVADRSYGCYGSDYAFWVNGRNDSPISFYLNNRRPVSALELRVAYNPEVSEYLGFYDEPRMQQMETREVAQGEGYLSLVIADFSGNSIAPGSQKLFTVSFTSTNDPSAYFYIENFIIADTAANRITPKVFYQDSYSPFETVTADTTAARPRMVLSATEVSFGQVPVGQATSKKIIILNLGEADLVVSRISSSSPVFTAGTVSATIPPRTSLDIAVSCRPAAEQDYTGTLTITTGDGTAEVALTGTGSAGPAAPGCDFNGDGRITVSDVIALLLFQRANPGDLRGDFNRDGNINVVDAVAMLLAMRDGTCPDAGTLQE